MRYSHRKKLRAFKKRLGRFVIVFILFLLIVVLLRLAFSKRAFIVKPVINFINTHRYLHRAELIKCNLLRKVYDNSPHLAGYVLQLTKQDRLEMVWLLNVARSSKFLPEFTKYKANNILYWKGSDWISLYNTDTPVAQIITLPHYAKHEKIKPLKFIVRQLVYTTGVIPNFIVIVDKNFKLLASSVNIKSAQDIVNIIRSHKAIHIKPVLDNLYVLEDGTEVYYTNYRSFALQYSNFNKLDFLADEHAFVEVYNATNLNGYGGFCSHILRQYGIDVSRLGTIEHPAVLAGVQSCNALVYVPRVAGYKTLQFIRYLFDIPNACVKQGRPPFLLTTGDIVIILNKTGFFNE